MVVVILASVGPYSSATADTVAVWLGVATLAGLGFLTGRIARQPWPRCVLYAGESAFIGLAIVVLEGGFQEDLGKHRRGGHPACPLTAPALPSELSRGPEVPARPRHCRQDR